MSISYDLFTGAFLAKVTEYNLLDLDMYNRNQMVEGYMKRACTQFNKICKYDLTDRDDILRQFNLTISDDEIDEESEESEDPKLVKEFLDNMQIDARGAASGNDVKITAM